MKTRQRKGKEKEEEGEEEEEEVVEEEGLHVGRPLENGALSVH